MQHSNQDMGKPEEIGLVDLAAIVVIRRVVAISVLLLTALAGIIYILIAPEQYQYRSLFQVAQVRGGAPVQSTEYLVSKLETFWLPQLESQYQANGERFSGKPAFSRSAASTIIEFRSDAAREDEQLVREIHENLMDRLLKEQNEHFTDQKESLEEQLNSRDALIERIADSENDQSVAAVLKVRNELKRELDGLRPADVLTTVSRSVKPYGLPAWQVMVGFLAAGIVLGIMAAFIAEFSARVRAKLR